jgi:hypothetical protein
VLTAETLVGTKSGHLLQFVLRPDDPQYTVFRFGLLSLFSEDQDITTFEPLSEVVFADATEVGLPLSNIVQVA